MPRLNPDMHLVPSVFSVDALERIPTRNGFGDGLVALGKEHDDVVALCADVTDSVRMGAFRDAFPERFVQMGVAEQNMAVVAAGMAKEGYVPFLSTYGVFSPGRNWDQIRISICYNDMNVKIAGAHTGISVGPDGATHQAMEDIAITRVLPNMTVLAPVDSVQTAKAVRVAYEHKGPVYLRFARVDTPVFTTEDTPFEIGRAQVFVTGTDVTIIGCGPLVHEALLAAQTLEQEHGISAEVLNLPTIKPMDDEAVVASAKKTGCVVTVEEHQVTGGLGGAVAEVLGEQCPVPLKRVGMPDAFGESGKPDELLEAYGMTASAIVEAARSVRSRVDSL